MPTITRENAAQFRRPLNRPAPLMEPPDYKTYAVSAPPVTHRRFASCEELGCQQHARGWRTVVDVSTQAGRSNAEHIRLKAGRRYTASQSGDVVTFNFPAGQRCFRSPPPSLLGRDAATAPQYADKLHTVPLGRPALFVVRGGDWRARTGPVRRMRPDQWVDDFANHQDRLARGKR